jgi:hypothetical protein
VAAGGTGGRRNPKLQREGEWSRRGMATGSGNGRVFGERAVAGRTGADWAVMKKFGPVYWSIGYSPLAWLHLVFSGFLVLVSWGKKEDVKQLGI